MQSMIDNDTDALGAEFSSAILSALGGDDISVPSAPRMSKEEQIQYIMKHTGSLQLVDRKAVGMILIMNDRKHALLPSASGTIINLDQLPQYIIDQMYEFVSYKINDA